ncbi:MAG: hypothetical protein ACK56F_21040, partial [bacterium]
MNGLVLAPREPSLSAGRQVDSVGLGQRGQCILFSVVFTTSPPPAATTTVFGSYLSSLYCITDTVSPVRARLT